MTKIWEDFPEECHKIGDYIFEASKPHNRPHWEVFRVYHEFIRHPRRHSSYREAWSEFVKEKGLEGMYMIDEEPSQTKETDVKDLERLKETSLRWGDDKELFSEIVAYIFGICASRNIPLDEAHEIITEFCESPRRHLSYKEAWIEFEEEKNSKATEIMDEDAISKLLEAVNNECINSRRVLDDCIEARRAYNKFMEELAIKDLAKQKVEPTESVTTQIELDSERNTSEDPEAYAVVETAEILGGEEDEKSSLPKEEAHHEEKDKDKDKDKLFPNYDSQLQNILDEFMKTNQASFDKFEARLGENAYAMGS
ncbi:hypothetical protein A2U01_0013338 [Trifolium medium]|uniref:Uncharacterized protein n=1 Tax=Trifolium medium TaxID=97028 RepID=A0A392MZR1_9FABA|nr:hypothetical protein [Trifolium medium]